MANWKVSKEIVEVIPHNNADSLEIIKVGEYQLVSGKGNYTTGDTVIVIPAGSVLSNGAMLLEYGKYLSGGKKDRVKGIQLRGEVSQGITWPVDNLEEAFDARTADLIEAAPVGEDISELLGITKYEPPIPANLRGQVRGIFLGGPKGEINHNIYMHDAYQWGAFSKDFDPEEIVVVTEKVHGSLCSYTVVVADGQIVSEILSSKGQLKRGIQLLETPDNLYWRAVRYMGLKDRVQHHISSRELKEGVVTVTGELIPVQAGYTYGATANEPLIKLFDVEENGIHLPHYYIDESLLYVWVPVLAIDQLKNLDVYELAKGREQVSGKELSIREGVCVTPEVPRQNAKGNFNLVLKVINPKYSAKETGEEIN